MRLPDRDAVIAVAMPEEVMSRRKGDRSRTPLPHRASGRVQGEPWDGDVPVQPQIRAPCAFGLLS